MKRHEAIAKRLRRALEMSGHWDTEMVVMHDALKWQNDLLREAITLAEMVASVDWERMEPHVIQSASLRAEHWLAKAEAEE